MAAEESMSREEVGKLPYLDLIPDDGRIVELRAYYDHEVEDWFLFVPVGKGELGRILPGEVESGSFFSSSAVDNERDFHFPTASLVAKHLSFPGASIITGRLESDLQQMAAVLGRIDVILDTTALSDGEKSALLEAELEYVFGLTRSFYDLLQRLIRRLGRTVHDSVTDRRRSFQDLPDSFAKVAIDGPTGTVRDPDAITKKWGLFPELARFYSAEGSWFRILREARDGIYHHGKTVSSIFMLPEGPAVRTVDAPWNAFPVWEPKDLIRDTLGPVNALVGHVFDRAISASTNFMEAFLTHVAVPRALGSNMDVYVRGPFTENLIRLDERIANPWRTE